MPANIPTRLPSTFHRLAWSNLAAQSAEQIGLAAAPMVAVFAFGAGAGATGGLQAAQTLPFLLLSIPAGMIVDRASRRRLMTYAEALRAASLVAILVLAALHLLNLPMLAILGFIGATGTVAYGVAAPSLVPALVPGNLLAAANGRIELARTVAFAAGPALGGALVGWTGGALAFAVAAALSACAAFLLAGLDEPSRPTLSPRRPWHDLREGAGFVFGHALLRPILATAVFFNLSFFILQAVYVPYAVHALGLSAFAVGTTLATYGIGMIGGALLAARIARWLPFGVVIAIGPSAGLAAALVMVLTIWLPIFPLAALSFFLMGIGPILWVISTTTLRQTVTPGAMLGRVSAIMTTATYGSRPIGAGIGALLGGWYGDKTCIVVAAIGFLVQAAIILRSPVARIARQPEAARRPRNDTPSLAGEQAT